MEQYSTRVSGAKPLADRGSIPSPSRPTNMNPGDVGILKSTILPSFALHSGLSVTSYIISRATGRAEVKDWYWPSSQVLNAWWSAIGARMCHDNVSFADAWNGLSWTEKLLLGCVSIWGTRLFYRISKRSIKRGDDDPRYNELKTKDPSFWNSALYKQYLPEAAFLTFITLPFTLPFRLNRSTLSLEPEVSGLLRALGVGLFSTGLAMEVMADTQLELHGRERTDLCRHGVWSIVRHPNYLGDTLVHCSFALLNAANKFNPLVLLGPVANYVFLRCVGGDKQTEASQEERYRKSNAGKYQQLQAWRREKNSFWPGLAELANRWTWVVLGGGLVGVFVEEVVRGVLEE